MGDPSPLRRTLRFGVYQCDLSAGELHKNGIKVRLSGQPFRLLTILLERPGEVVTRRELGERLWPAGTFVDFEDGLNTAIKKLRVALDDQSENPRFLETIPRRGYRFIAPVEIVAENGQAKKGLAGENVAKEPAEPVEAASGDMSASRRTSAWHSRAKWAVGTAIAMLAGFALWWNAPLPPPRVLSVEQITTSARIDTPVKPVTDGAHVYYIERDGGHWDLMQSPVNGGESRRIDFPTRSAMVMDASARTSELLLGSFGSRDALPQLWTMPEEGSAAARLGNISATTAAYSPDGKTIAYASGNALWLMDGNGRNPRKVANLPNGAAWLTWSPGGRRLRFTVGTLFDGSPTSLWEISADGKNLHAVLPGWTHPASECCGSWTADGRYYIFTSYHNGDSNLWALREKGLWWRRSPRGPFQLTFGPDSPWGGTPSANGREIFFYNGVWREELERFDAKTGQFSPLGTKPDATLLSYSRDGNWMAYVDSRSKGLFRSRTDGTERIQLAPGEMNASFPRWSADGKWIVFGGTMPGQHWNSYVVPSTGGRAEPLMSGANLRDADWSSDGKSLVASQELGSKDSDGWQLVIIDFATRRATAIPGSEGMMMSRWSYDGRFISATAEDQRQLEIWDVARRKWSMIARGAALGISVWSPDSRYLYFQDLLGKGERLSRYDVRNRRVETVGDFSMILRSGTDRCALAGVAPDGTPIIELNRGALDLFAAHVTLP
jgi:DNA-binding winged helix-turn-helix (wHTH) protein/Tol biopolymer transport system component